jgi:hypothetical protein
MSRRAHPWDRGSRGLLDPESYRNFIRRYQDRILFGSDAIVSEPEKVQSALEFLERFLGNTEIFSKLAPTPR